MERLLTFTKAISRLSLALLLFTIGVGIYDANGAHGADLKVIDGKGLTLAFKKITEPTDIQVVVTTPVKEDRVKSLRLSNIDGLAADINPKISDSHLLIFQKVREGTWQLKGFDDRNIRQVKVQ